MQKIILLPFFCYILLGVSAQYNPISCGSSMLISTGTVPVSGDDNIAAVALPFNFKFYGATYSNLYISTNGFVSFDGGAGHGCCDGYILPNSASVSYIALAHTDLYVPSTTPGTDGSVYYGVTGSAPNQVFVVHYQSAYQCCGSTPVATGEIQLFETTNEVKIVTTGINAPSSNTTMGLAKGDDATAAVISSRNSTNFTTASECWSLSNSGTLPLTLLSFIGKPAGVKSNLLEWTTSFENNTRSFDIQRSINGTDYVTVQSLPAAGNSSTNSNYTYTDIISQVSSGVFYYRLKMIDIDAVYKYSPVIKIRAGSNGFSVESIPNPFTRHLTVNIESLLPDNATIIITDLNGRLLLQKKHKLYPGNNAIELKTTANLRSGTYLLKVITSNKEKTLKIIKQ
ncbi:MAG: T9SS type A sorting domain-containing protein [Chitinophagaceae bacterium]